MNVKTAIVTFDSGPLAQAYAKNLEADSENSGGSGPARWPLLLDADRSLYRKYEMDRVSSWAVYGPASIWHYLKLVFLKGKKLERPGSDFNQVGGDVLIDPDGLIRYHFVSTSPHDRPTPERVLQFVH